jgi:hypothetical protein
MIKIAYRGRLGNNLIQYAAAYVLAQKTGLKLDAPHTRKYTNTGIYKTSSDTNNTIDIDFGSVFEVNSLSGESFNDFIELTDNNYFEHLKNPTANKGYRLNGYFQHGRLLVDYREEILNLYKLPESDFTPNKNDAFVACRLGDCLITSRTYCTMDYINHQLQASRDSYDKVYITSDTIGHPSLVDLIKKYDLTIYQNEPLNTILFACRFNNLMLSAGSFSYWMAYLSEATNFLVYNTTKDPLQRDNAWGYNKNVKFIK